MSATTTGDASIAKAQTASGNVISKATQAAAQLTSETASKLAAATNAQNQKMNTANIQAAQQEVSTWQDIVIRGFVVLTDLVLLAGVGWFMLKGEASRIPALAT